LSWDRLSSRTSLKDMEVAMPLGSEAMPFGRPVDDLLGSPTMDLDDDTARLFEPRIRIVAVQLLLCALDVALEEIDSVTYCMGDCRNGIDASAAIGLSFRHLIHPH